jgi:hypothetical protein
MQGTALKKTRSFHILYPTLTVESSSLMLNSLNSSVFWSQAWIFFSCHRLRPLLNTWQLKLLMYEKFNAQEIMKAKHLPDCGCTAHPIKSLMHHCTQCRKTAGSISSWSVLQHVISSVYYRLTIEKSVLSVSDICRVWTCHIRQQSGTCTQIF